MKILLVGGTWTTEPHVNPETERCSSIVNIVNVAIKNYCEDHYDNNYKVDMYNGGCYYNLEMILNKTSEYDVVFWWPNIPDNSLPKIRDVKAVAPHVMLVTSKRNDNDKYTFMELTQRALAIKANMFFEFKKREEKVFETNVYDPLGCCWYKGTDVVESVVSAIKRLEYLRSMTRQKTVQSNIDKKELLDIYLNRSSCVRQSNKDIETPDESEFIDIVRKHAETFYTIFNPGKDVKRFLGNASLRASLNIDSTRCMRGMPSFKKDNMIFVSQRNIDKQFISLENFVPCYIEDGKLYYCGDKKPSVDAPIQIRLYNTLPNINYIIHSHCYIDGAIFTNKSIPCGAVEEVEEVLSLIDKTYGLRNLDYYAINLKGHGSLLMAKNVSLMHDIQYIGRQMPEIMF